MGFSIGDLHKLGAMVLLSILSASVRSLGVRLHRPGSPRILEQLSRSVAAMSVQETDWGTLLVDAILMGLIAGVLPFALGGRI